LRAEAPYDSGVREAYDNVTDDIAALIPAYQAWARKAKDAAKRQLDDLKQAQSGDKNSKASYLKRVISR